MNHFHLIFWSIYLQLFFSGQEQGTSAVHGFWDLLNLVISRYWGWKVTKLRGREANYYASPNDEVKNTLSYLTPWSPVLLENFSVAQTQVFLNIVWNSKVHYWVLKSPRLAPTLSQSTPSHPVPVRIILTLSSNLSLGHPSGLWPGFPIKCVPLLRSL
jgi:hypothetical protein